jgi:hypothetical protein
MYGEDLDLPDGVYLGEQFLTCGTDTGLRAGQGEDLPVPGDVNRSAWAGHYNMPHHDSKATLRRVGWLDQRGRVWLALPPADLAAREGCGSFAPLLIDARED